MMYFVIAVLICYCTVVESKISAKLHFDPEMYMDTCQIVQFHKYPCESHKVITSDGYILVIHRIPRGKSNVAARPNSVVFLQHGLLDSSFTWVVNYPNQSLAYILADTGFDVWMANSRGNMYSNKHIKYSVKSKKFWDFSFEEMALYDLSASINYVLNRTEMKKLSYIGHSQGTLIGFIKFFADKDSELLRTKIASFSALAPVIYLGYVKSAIKYLEIISKEIEIYYNFFYHGQFLSNNFLLRLMARFICGKNYIDILCTDLAYLIAGYDSNNLNLKRLPIILSHFPAGTSVKNMIHFIQGYQSNKFQKYDYGFLHNLKQYGQLHPPQYNLTTHSANRPSDPPPPPLAMFWGGSDWLADPEDVDRALCLLSSKYNVDKYFTDKYNHMDFIWGENAANVVYKNVINFIKKYI